MTYITNHILDNYKVNDHTLLVSTAFWSLHIDWLHCHGRYLTDTLHFQARLSQKVPWVRPSHAYWERLPPRHWRGFCVAARWRHWRRCTATGHRGDTSCGRGPWTANRSWRVSSWRHSSRSRRNRTRQTGSACGCAWAVGVRWRRTSRERATVCRSTTSCWCVAARCRTCRGWSTSVCAANTTCRMWRSDSYVCTRTLKCIYVYYYW